MVFVDNISDLEFYSPNPVFDCYADIVVQPSDIMLQCQLGTSYDIANPMEPVIFVCQPDGTELEDASAYFNKVIYSTVIGLTTYYYVNIVATNYSQSMIDNICFVLNVVIPKNGSGLNYFNKWTQKYELLNGDNVPITGVVVTTDGITNIATACGSDSLITSNCKKNIVQLVWQNDCVDDYTGDFYGTGQIILSDTGTFIPFVKLSNVEAMVKTLPRTIKRTVSINCRTQRTETTQKYQLQGVNSGIAFPQWKMQEIEGMLLSNHFFIDGKEYQSEGGAPFTQLGTPQNCLYRFKLEMDLQDCYEWQVFGCTVDCTPIISYYPIAF